MVIILPQRGQVKNYLKRDLDELENSLWAGVESNIRARMARNWTVLSIGRVGYHAFIHHFISSNAFLLSFGKDDTYSSMLAWNPFFFRHSLGISRYARCIQKDLLSSFWWDEFEVEFWQACVYLKTSAKHLQCLLSLFAFLVALRRRFFNVLVPLS